jgi:hypothetical protein
MFEVLPPAAPQVVGKPAEPAPPPPAPLPPVADADGRIRAALAGLLPEGWLSQTDLARRFVAGMDAVAEGRSPRTPWGFLLPVVGKFQVETRAGKTVIAEASFARYDPLVAVVDKLDPAAVAKAWQVVGPLLESAYAEIGRPGTTLHGRLGQALGLLAKTPVPQGDLAVVPSPVAYAYADPALESLPAASKHLVRMGPKNQQRLQARLRELADALGLQGR